MPPFGGSGSGSAREEGGNILAEWDMDWSGGDAFNSLLGRFGEMYDLGLENMRAQQPRDAEAFSLWKRGKESGLTDDAMRRDMARRSYANERSALFDAQADKRAEEIRRRQLMDTVAPRRMVTGPGVVPGWTMDPMSMSASQRQVFLPQKSVETTPNMEEPPDEFDRRSGVSPMDLFNPTDAFVAMSQRRR